MEKYIVMVWPEIQDYFNHNDFSKKVYYDPKKDTWLIPETWLEENPEKWMGTFELEDQQFGGDIGDSMG